jgi:hypothetical protein
VHLGHPVTRLSWISRRTIDWLAFGVYRTRCSRRIEIVLLEDVIGVVRQTAIAASVLSGRLPLCD